MDTLLELSKRHKEWLKMATKITSSSDKAQDLVQDTYLAMGLSDSVLREEYSNFIFTVMHRDLPWSLLALTRHDVLCALHIA